MIISKEYKFEAAHRVKNCASTRCSKNIHGHSFRILVQLHSNALDKGDMVVDFGLLKATIGEFIDWFDHSLIVWTEDEELLDVARTVNERIVALGINSTAENLSKIFFMACHTFIEKTIFCNGETNVSVQSVRVHETATGYAECTLLDIHTRDWKQLKKISFPHVLQSHELLKVLRDDYDSGIVNPKEL